MANERGKLIGIYIIGQIAFFCMGVLPGFIFPPLFAWCYWRAKKEQEQ